MKKISFLVCAAVVMMLVMVSNALAFTPAGLIQGLTGIDNSSASVSQATDNNNTTFSVIPTGNSYIKYTLSDISTITGLRVLATGTTGMISFQFYDSSDTFIGYGNSVSVDDTFYVASLDGDLVTFPTPIENVKYFYAYNCDAGSVNMYELDIYGESVDTTAPATPTDLLAVAGDTQVSLSWDANTDIDLAGYNVYRDGIKINTSLVTDESYVDTGLTNDIEYTYTITAVDTSDNESAESEEALATPTASSSEGRALIVITLDNGLEKEYDWSMDEVNDFIDWYDARAEGTGLTRYVVEKQYNTGPFISRKEYLIFKKIVTFEVMEYNEIE